MAQASRIEWTDATWNPVTGCSMVSDGCLNCYARRMAQRLNAMHNPRYRNGFRVTLHRDMLDAPKRWRKPRMIFVTSMSDLFHPSVPIPFIRDAFAVMNDCVQHVFQILTKRPEIAAEVADRVEWTDNIWFGSTIENAEVLERVDYLSRIPAAVRFVSAEPLLGPLDSLRLDNIGWVIVGGESGPRARPMQAEWVRSIRDRCIAAKIPFFFKQWGGVNKKKTGRILDGRTWDERPSSCVDLLGS